MLLCVAHGGDIRRKIDLLRMQHTVHPDGATTWER
jgi:hypothetical protein